MMDRFWDKKRVFVTGGSGFVGSWLIDALLKDGAHVVALVQDFSYLSRFSKEKFQDKVDLVQGNLEDFQVLERAVVRHEVDTVFHLGAQTLVETAFRSPWDTLESNVRGTYNLLEVCRRHIGQVSRIVLASSDKAYGSQSILPYQEEMPSQGTHPYDVSKSCADLIALAYHKTYHLPLVIGRCANIYGGGDLHWSRLVPGTIRSLYNQEPILVRSDGTLTREYLYVTEAIDAYLKMGRLVSNPNIQGQIFNFGPDRPSSVLQVIKALQSLMNCPHAKMQILKKANHEIPHQYLDSTKAKNLLQWQSHLSLEEGLLKTIDWYTKFFAKGTFP